MKLLFKEGDSIGTAAQPKEKIDFCGEQQRVFAESREAFQRLVVITERRLEPYEYGSDVPHFSAAKPAEGWNLHRPPEPEMPGRVFGR